jgi:hypothetical protein
MRWTIFAYYVSLGSQFFEISSRKTGEYRRTFLGMAPFSYRLCRIADVHTVVVSFGMIKFFRAHASKLDRSVERLMRQRKFLPRKRGLGMNSCRLLKSERETLPLQRKAYLNWNIRLVSRATPSQGEKVSRDSDAWHQVAAIACWLWAINSAKSLAISGAFSSHSSRGLKSMS